MVRSGKDRLTTGVHFSSVITRSSFYQDDELVRGVLVIEQFGAYRASEQCFNVRFFRGIGAELLLWNCAHTMSTANETCPRRLEE